MTDQRPTTSVSTTRAASIALATCIAGVACPALAATAPTIEPRILAQQGLGLGMAFNLLQTEADVINNFSNASTTCAKQPFGGGIKTPSSTNASSTVTKANIVIYYDLACTRPYINATVTVTESTNKLSIVETASYLLSHGAALGSLSASEVYIYSKSNVVLNAVGKFTPAGGAPVVDVGMACTASTASNGNTFNCESGVAQRFPVLNLSLASVTPLSFKQTSTAYTPSVSFTGNSATLQTGPAGSLSITRPTFSTLGIGGNGTRYGSTTATGGLGKFALFPPLPTQWTFTDSAHDARFSLHLVSNTTHASSGSVVTISTGAVLGTVAVDVSGTGTVKYADGRTAVVRSWLPSD